MKSRTGFVSNSSTSSFIVAGIEMEQGDPRIPRDENDDPIYDSDGLSYFTTEYNDETGVYGKWVASVEHGEITTLNMQKLATELEKVRKDIVLELKDVNPSDVELHWLGE